jgi:membrane protease YdiL (CAAX protease family)
VVVSVLGLHYLLNRVVPDRLIVPASLGGAAVIAGIARAGGASWDDQGLGPSHIPSGIDAGGWSGTLVAAVTTAGLLFRPTRRFYWDERILRQTHVETTYQALIRIPFGTALAEEVIFRGAVPALLRRRLPPILAGLSGSALFGLWHIVPTLDRIETSPLTRDTGPVHRTMSTAGVVALTSAFGLGFSYLRYASGSIIAPTMAHAAANSIGMAGGWASAWIQKEADRVAAEVRSDTYRPTHAGK